MNRVSVAASSLAALFLCAVLGLCVSRVAALMSRELDRSGPDTALIEGTSAILLEADLLAGDDLTFELCSSDTMQSARWAGAATLTLSAGEAEPRDRILDETIDPATLEGARRGGTGACLDFAHAGPLETSGHYVVGIENVQAALAGVAVRARVVAERPLGASDRNFVLGVLLGAMALVIALALKRPSDPEPPRGGLGRATAWGIGVTLGVVSVALCAIHPQLTWVTKIVLGITALVVTLGSARAMERGLTGGAALLGVVAVVDLSTCLSFLPLPGPAYGLLAGLVLALSEVGIALAFAATLVRTDRASVLAMQRPRRTSTALVGFALAPFVGILLRILAMRALALVPSTGEAPIEAYVQWPSGLLSFAALSAIAPIGEEVFFRGLVYGSLRGEGGARKETLAFLGAWLLFVVAHLPQTWGSWGGLLAITIAGLGFTTLRALTGSVLVAALAHLVYNGLLAVAALTS